MGRHLQSTEMVSPVSVDWRWRPISSRWRWRWSPSRLEMATHQSTEKSSPSTGDGDSPVDGETFSVDGETFSVDWSLQMLKYSVMLMLLFLWKESGMGLCCETMQRPAETRALNNTAIKISTEAYEYDICWSAEEYSNARLEPPRYDLTEKYTPKRAVVTVTFGPPHSRTDSPAAMMTFPVSARPPAPATKISLGSKKNDPPKAGNSNSEAPVPTGLPLTATRPASPSGENEAAWTTKRGKEKEVLEVEEVMTLKRTCRDGSGSTTLMAHSVTDLFARAKDGDEIHRRDVAPLKKALAKRDQRVKELESKLKTAEETGRRAVLAAVSRTPIGEDLMYEFGTWAFICGRRAMQNDVRAALKVSVEEDDLPRLLVVLPEDVPDPGPTPFSKVPDEQASGSVAGAFAGPTVEVFTEPSAGPTAEAVAEPSAEPLKGGE
nr:uncharacterized protein LOC109184184 [Ipomoea trifida]